MTIFFLKWNFFRTTRNKYLIEWISGTKWVCRLWNFIAKMHKYMSTLAYICISDKVKSRFAICVTRSLFYASYESFNVSKNNNFFLGKNMYPIFFFFFYIFTHLKKKQRSIKIFLLNKYVFLSWQFLHWKKYFKALSKSLIKYSKIDIFLSHFEFNDIYLYSLSIPLLIAFIDLSDIYAKQRRPNQVCRNTFSLPWVFLEEHHWLSLQPQTGSRPDINLCLLIFHWCNFF